MRISLVATASLLIGGALFAGDALAAESHWLPTLGSLALGGLLGGLLGGGGFAGAFVLVVLTFAALIFFWLRGRGRATLRRPAPQYAALGKEAVAAPPPSVPPGFDVAEFVRNWKLCFVKLQLAGELGDLTRVRGIATAQMYGALCKGPVASGRSEVVTLEAQLVEVRTEADAQLAAVRFSGTAREAPGTAAHGFAEVWRLVKASRAPSGWLLAAIQPVR